MVAPAKQHEVQHGGRTAVGPMNDMVRVAPRVGPVAAREPAVAVSDDHGTPHGG